LNILKSIQGISRKMDWHHRYQEYIRVWRCGFDNSNTEFKAKLYVIEGKTTKNQEIILKVSNRENKAILEEIIKK
jgi:hypothetical protein